MTKSRYLSYKTILALCLLMLNANALWATEGITKVFKFAHANLSLTQNDASFRETQNLLFKGRAMFLDDLISKKVASGEFEHLKFDIRIYDPVISRAQLIIRRKQNRCEIILSGYPSIQALYSVVAYASTHQKTLEYVGEGAVKQIARFFKQQTHLLSLSTNNITVWSNSGLSLRYHADSLQYQFNHVPLSYPADGNLPVKIRDRFLLFTHASIAVIKQGKQIAVIKLQKPFYTDFDCGVNSGLVTICDGGPQNWLYRYAYEQNRFFRNPKYLP